MIVNHSTMKGRERKKKKDELSLITSLTFMATLSGKMKKSAIAPPRIITPRVIRRNKQHLIKDIIAVIVLA